MTAGRWLARARRFHREDSGAELVEFAVSSILFLTMLFGIIEFSRMIMDYSLVSSGARDGARYASARGSLSGHAASASDVQSFVAGHSSGLLATSNVTVTWPSGNTPGNYVQVTTTYNFVPIVHLLPSQTVRLSSTSRLIISR
jgi:Flp pilus assembly protein TadG